MKILSSTRFYSLLMLMFVSPLSSHVLSKIHIPGLVGAIEHSEQFTNKTLTVEQIEQLQAILDSVIDAITDGQLNIDLESAFAYQRNQLRGCEDICDNKIIKLRKKLYVLNSAKFFDDVEMKENLTVNGDLVVDGTATFNGPIMGTVVIENISATDATISGTLIAGNAVVACDLTVGCNISMNDSLSPAVGNIIKNGIPFIHNFGSFSTFVGSEAGNFTILGEGNTGIGAFALTSNTTGFINTATGGVALASNTTGSGNVANGVATLMSNTTGNANVAVGFLALLSNTIGNDNIAIGAATMTANTTGSSNTAVGVEALNQNITGSHNLALGINAGNFLINGDDNIYIGNEGIASESGTIKIGRTPTHTSTFIHGVRGVATAIADAIPVLVDSAGQFGTISSSRRFKRNIQDMNIDSAVILNLRPVTFAYNHDEADTKQFGLIAEEVDQLLPDIVIKDKDGNPYTVQYHVLPVILLHEIQRQHDALQQQYAYIAALAKRVAQLEARA